MTRRQRKTFKGGGGVAGGRLVDRARGALVAQLDDIAAASLQGKGDTGDINSPKRGERKTTPGLIHG